MKALLVSVAILSLVFAISKRIYDDTKASQVRNIWHDGHMFIQTSTTTIHSPRCTCQSSLRAMRRE